jgi:hypothetical protein
MKSIFILCGLMMLSTTATPNKQGNPDQSPKYLEPETAATTSLLIQNNCVTCGGSADINLDDIQFIEDEAQFDLGFDTSDYLPEGFDPYEVYVDLDAISYIEEEDEDALGFETSAWLPEGFDPYAAPADIASISYLETEEVMSPEVDTKNWLPEGFDPYVVYRGYAVICKEIFTTNTK